VKIFISYRRADSSPYSGRLRDALTAHFQDGSVFFDVNSIEAGAVFTNSIVAEMTLADVVLVVIGPTWLTAGSSDAASRLDDSQDPVRNEILEALDRNLEIIPVLVGGATMPRPEKLPDAIRSVVLRNALRLSDEQWEDDVKRLASAIKRLVARDRGAWSPELAKAVDAIQRKQYAAAVDLLSQALTDHRTADGYYHRGLAYFYQGNFHQAAADFEQAINLAPESAMAHRQLGNALYSLSDYDGALASYDHAIAREPREPRAYLNRAELHLKLGNIADAIADFQKVVDLRADAGLEQIAEARLLEVRARRLAERG
jgi:tetratricopeptide (TPR) repeat protein